MIYISGIAERLTIAISKHVSFLYAIKHFDIFFSEIFSAMPKRAFAMIILVVKLWVIPHNELMKL